MLTLVNNCCSKKEPLPYVNLFLLTCLENCIDGLEFTLLKDDEVKEMVPPLGIAKKIIRLIPRPTVILTVCIFQCIS